MMAHAGLAEPSLRLLRAAVADGGTVARFRAKIAVVPGSGCVYWTSAISGRGHGRFWVGEGAGRDGVVIAHRATDSPRARRRRAGAGSGAGAPL